MTVRHPPKPTHYESEIAEALSDALSRADLRQYPEVIADALAKQRARLTALALALLPAAGGAGISETTLERMDAEGWTPRQVHALISEHRALLLQLRRSRELIPAAFGNGAAS